MEHIEREIEEDEDEDFVEVSDELQDKLDIVVLKHQLICAAQIDLKKEYEGEEEYGMFIDILNEALTQEPVFFMLDERFLRIAEDIVHNRRFDYNRVSNYNEVINEIIGKINTIRTTPEDIKQRQVQAYVAWNLQVRQLGGRITQEDFYKILGYDAELISGLINKDLSDLPQYYFFSSTNYLLSALPELFEEYPDVLEQTTTKLDESSKKRGFWNWAERDFAKVTKENLQKVKVKTKQE